MAGPWWGLRYQHLQTTRSDAMLDCPSGLDVSSTHLRFLAAQPRTHRRATGTPVAGG